MPFSLDTNDITARVDEEEYEESGWKGLTALKLFVVTVFAAPLVTIIVMATADVYGLLAVSVGLRESPPPKVSAEKSSISAMDKTGEIVDAIDSASEDISMALGNQATALEQLAAKPDSGSRSAEAVIQALKDQKEALTQAIEKQGTMLTLALDKQASVIVSLNENQTAAINSLSEKQAAAIESLGEKQAEAIDSLSEKQAAAISSLSEKEITAYSEAIDKQTEAITKLAEKKPDIIQVHPASAPKAMKEESAGKQGFDLQSARRKIMELSGVDISDPIIDGAAFGNINNLMTLNELNHVLNSVIQAPANTEGIDFIRENAKKAKGFVQQRLKQFR